MDKGMVKLTNVFRTAGHQLKDCVMYLHCDFTLRSDTLWKSSHKKDCVKSSQMVLNWNNEERTILVLVRTCSWLWLLLWLHLMLSYILTWRSGHTHSRYLSDGFILLFTRLFLKLSNSNYIIVNAAC